MTATSDFTMGFKAICRTQVVVTVSRATSGAISVKDEGAGEVRRIASEARHQKLVPSVEYDEDYIY